MSEPRIRLRRPPRPRSGGGGCLKPVLVGLILAILVAIGSSWKNTFDQCAKTEVELRADYWHLSLEIFLREVNIFYNIAKAKSIDDLRARLKQPYYVSSQYKDKSIGELRADWQINQDRLRVVEGNDDYGAKLQNIRGQINQMPDYDKYNAVLLYAAVSDNLNDKDLKEMSGEAMVMMQLDKLSLFFKSVSGGI